MLAELPQDIANVILDLLTTRDQLKLMIVSKPWQEVYKQKHEMPSITIATTRDRLEGTYQWLRDLDERTYLTVQDLALTVKRSFWMGEYDAEMGKIIISVKGLLLFAAAPQIHRRFCTRTMHAVWALLAASTVIWWCCYVTLSCLSLPHTLLSPCEMCSLLVWKKSPTA